MTEYALVSPDNEILASRDFADADEVPALAPNKGVWLPVETVDADFDPVAQVREGPVVTIQRNRVLHTYAVRAKSGEELDDMRAAKRLAISTEFQTRAADVISYSVGGVSKTWDADAEAVTNITGVVLMIAAGVSVPDPRPWTAHGELTPTTVSHAELLGLGGAIAARKDALFAKKKTLEAALAALTDPAAIDAFDPTQGWA